MSLSLARRLMPRCMSISCVTIRLTITSARGAAKLGANLDSLPLRGANSLNTHTNITIMKLFIVLFALLVSGSAIVQPAEARTAREQAMYYR